MATTGRQRLDSTFNSYAIGKKIGEGGSGIVNEVTDQDGNRLAVKRLKRSCLNSERLRRFRNEIGFCHENKHSNILTVLDDGFSDDSDVKCPFYVMRHYEETVRSLLKRGISPNTVLPLFSQMIDGVEAAHLRGVWHRDLKPENLLHDPAEDRLVVADFGIAHFNEEVLLTAVETKASERLANFQYSAPEQRVRGAVVDARADIYALGIILNEMFTGEILQGAGYTTIESLQPEYAYLDELVDRMVQQDPTKRLQSVREIKQLLRSRHNEFIGQQRLSELDATVVPIHSIEDKAAQSIISVESVDYRGGRLVFNLNQVPLEDWIQSFGGIHYRQSLLGKDPKRFEFSGLESTIPADENEVERISSDFKGWIEMGNDNYRLALKKAARDAERREQERLKTEKLEEEKRQRILRMVNP